MNLYDTLKRNPYFPSALCSGTLNAILFNPFDRALYLSTTTARPFLCAENFAQPFQGFGQVAAFRVLSQGLYFAFQGTFRELFQSVCGDSALSYAGVGIAAGALNGVVLSPLTAIKFQMWNHDNAKMIPTTKKMWVQGGIEPFFKGWRATMLRDSVHGCIYEVCRQLFLKEISFGLDDPHRATKKFWCDMTAASLATMLSSPINFARNMQIASSPLERQESVRIILRELMKSARTKPSWMDTMQYLQTRILVGWGTARVGVGMAVGQYLFDTMLEFWRKLP